MKHPNKIPCWACGCVIGLEFESDDSDIVSAPWSGGTGFQVTGGFGSRFDMATFHGVVCDDCLEGMSLAMFQVESCQRSRATYNYKPPRVPHERQEVQD